MAPALRRAGGEGAVDVSVGQGPLVAFIAIRHSTRRRYVEDVTLKAESSAMPHYISLSQAADRILVSNRILVIGCSGGGKTTVALRMAERLGIEYQSLDRDVRWLPGWKERDRVEQRAIIADLVARDRWVMDGSGPSTFNLRVPRADLIVWVRVPRKTALFSLAGRVIGNYGRVRIAMAEGCPEPIPDRAFLSYVWNFEKETAPRFVEQLDRFGLETPIVILKSRKDARIILQD